MLFDSYAPFCKHLFVKNFTGARLNMVAITQANAHMLMSDYEARTEYELPVYVCLTVELLESCCCVQVLIVLQFVAAG